MPESLTLSTGTTSMQFVNGTNIDLVSYEFPAPSPEPSYASSADTEGEVFLGVRYRNRTIRLVVEVTGGSTTTETRLNTLEAIVGQVGREGGTLTWVTPKGSTAIFDIVTWAGFEPKLDVSFGINGHATVDMEFTAKPFWRGTPVTLADRTETSLPCLVWTETSVTGNVPALGKLVIDEDDADDQAWVIWGQQQRYYSSAASAALFFQAESLTAQGGSATATGATGASGTAPNVMRNTDLTTSFVSVLSGQATGGGAHMSHVGTFRVFARVYCPTGNTGTVEVALEWAEGDFRRPTRNAVVEYESAWEGSFRLVDLGSVTLTQVDSGTQRWEPRLLARSTVVGDEVDVDWLMLVPTDEGSGEVASNFALPSPTSFSARDEFDQSAGALSGKTLPIGGTWSGAGDADDFSVETSGKTAQRTATSDTALLGRTAIAGAATPTSIAVQVDFRRNADNGAPVYAPEQGVFARRVDASNQIRAVAYWYPPNGTDPLWQWHYVRVSKCIAGTWTTLADVPAQILATNTTYSLRLSVDAAGRFAVWLFSQGAAQVGGPVCSGSDSTLATGGTLASGTFGIYDEHQGSGAITRNYDNFAAWVPPADAAMFASQSLTVFHDKVRREDSGGTLSVKPSSYEGDYLLVPPTGPDSRTNRYIVKASRNVPGLGADSGTDDISARLTYTPRGLVVPS